MSTQTEWPKLAKHLMTHYQIHGISTFKSAALELRRLHNVNEDLVVALQAIELDESVSDASQQLIKIALYKATGAKA